MEARHVLDMVALAASLRQGGGCLVCVSGGADSMCMLRALHTVAPSLGLALEAVHVNHLVRGEEAMGDYELVRAECVRLGIPCHYRETQPLGRKPRGKTTEEYFRQQRYGQIFEVARERGIRQIAVGHNADDLAESFLMHLMRGAGLRGLSFRFAHRRAGFLIVRPLWQTTRHRILAFAKEHRVPFREDSSNKSTAFTRNRVRNQLIPFIEREFNPSARRALRRTTTVLSEAQAYIRSQARRALRRLVARAPDERSLPLRRLLRLPHVLQVEVVHLWLVGMLGSSARPSFEQCQALLRLANSRMGHRVRLAGGTTIARTEEALVALEVSNVPCAEPEEGAAADTIAREELARRYLRINPALPLARLAEPLTVVDTDASGRYEIEIPMLDRRRVRLRIAVCSQSVLPLDADDPLDEGDPPDARDLLYTGLPALPLVIRNRQPGDRISASVRLKSVLINDKVPYYLRDFLILVTDSHRRILAVVGMERITARIHNAGAESLRIEHDFPPQPK